MQCFAKIIILVLPGLFSGSISYAQATSEGKNIVSSYAPLPEGNNGIAAKHPGDKGITNDPAVIFADDFESYTQSDQVINHWDVIPHPKNINISTDPELIFRGKQALEIVIPQNTAEQSDGVNKVVFPERDILFLRYYAKFQSPFDVIGSSHNGSGITAHYFDIGHATPGIPANGTNKFLVNLENWRGDEATPSPGHLNLYVYHPEQRTEYGDHFFPEGIVLPFSSTPFDFGPDFISRSPIITPLDQWFCYEFMVQANTPGKRDGRIAVPDHPARAPALFAARAATERKNGSHAPRCEPHLCRRARGLDRAHRRSTG